MSKFYSPSQRGFYSTDVHGKDMPKDVVEISNAEWQRLLAGQGQDGLQILPDARGRPALLPPEKS